MADVKISALPAATTPLAGTEVLPIVQSGTTDQVSVANLTAGRTVAAATLNVDANTANAAVRITQTGAGNALLVEDSANPDATPFVVDAEGRVGAGTTAPGAALDVSGTSFIRNTRFGSPTAYVSRFANGTAASPTAALNNNGQILRFDFYDGTTYLPGAAIFAEVDGTPGTNDMPGRLMFSTTADGASTLTERMRIDSTGNTTFTGTAVMSSSFQRNRLINGNMYVAQRATSATVTAGTGVPTASTGYPCVDRFFVYSTGANVTAAQVSGAGANRNLLRITGAASVTAVGIGQRIEAINSYDLAGQTCTLSVDLANSLLTTVTWTASYATTTDTVGTIGTPTKTQIATGTFTVTSTLTRYSVNIAVPAAATTGVEILFTVGAQTSGTWDVGNVQFEPGTVATPFERRQYGQELALCQRYYGTATSQIVAAASSPAKGIFFKSSMRTAATIAGGGAGFSIINSTTEGFDCAQTTNANQTLTFSAEL